MSEVLKRAIELINIESISGNELAMADWLQRWGESHDLNVTRQEVAPGRHNVLAVAKDSPRLIFNSHIDTVPPFFPARIDGSRLRGRGACDTKSLIAAQLFAFEALLQLGYRDLGVLYVVGEEVDHCGMIQANQLGLNPDFLIVAEPTESKLARRQKGILKFKLTCSGRAGHSGYPECGESAIAPMVDILSELQSQAWPSDGVLGETTLNVGVLAGGRAANVIPDHCEAEVLVRVVTNHRDILQHVRSVVRDRAAIEVVAANDPVELALLDAYPSTVVSFNTDIPYFQFDGKAFLWGAGSILDAHTDHEYIEIDDLERAVAVYRDLAVNLLSH